MPVPDPLADDIGGISAWQPSAIRPWQCAAGQRRRRRIWQVSVSFYKAPHQPLHRIPNQSVLLLTQQNGPSLASPPPPVSPVPSSALHIPPSPPPNSFDVFSSALRSSVVSVVPSSHPLTPLCISTHIPSGFDAGYRLLLHYVLSVFSRRPFRHPTLLSLLLSSTHFSSRAPPLSVFHLGYPLVHVVMVQ